MNNRMVRMVSAAFALALVLGCAGTAFAEEKVHLMRRFAEGAK